MSNFFSPAVKVKVKVKEEDLIDLKSMVRKCIK